VSIAVDLHALGERLAEYGSSAYLLSVSEGDRPHVVSVQVRLDGDHLAADVGRRTATNLGDRPTATFLRPPPEGGAYSLIVDGVALTSDDSGPLAIRPTAAVLHRIADAPGDGATCLPLTAT